jgi:hypothetical protein
VRTLRGAALVLALLALAAVVRVVEALVPKR